MAKRTIGVCLGGEKEKRYKFEFDPFNESGKTFGDLLAAAESFFGKEGVLYYPEGPPDISPLVIDGNVSYYPEDENEDELHSFNAIHENDNNNDHQGNDSVTVLVKVRHNQDSEDQVRLFRQTTHRPTRLPTSQRLIHNVHGDFWEWDDLELIEVLEPVTTISIMPSVHSNSESCKKNNNNDNSDGDGISNINYSDSTRQSKETPLRIPLSALGVTLFHRATVRHLFDWIRNRFVVPKDFPLTLEFEDGSLVHDRTDHHKTTTTTTRNIKNTENNVYLRDGWNGTTGNDLRVSLSPTIRVLERRLQELQRHRRKQGTSTNSNDAPPKDTDDTIIVKKLTGSVLDGIYEPTDTVAYLRRKIALHPLGMPATMQALIVFGQPVRPADEHRLLVDFVRSDRRKPGNTTIHFFLQTSKSRFLQRQRQRQLRLERRQSATRVPFKMIHPDGSIERVDTIRDGSIDDLVKRARETYNHSHILTRVNDLNTKAKTNHDGC